MSIEVSANVDDPAGLIVGYGAGALLRLERASSEAGVYAEIATTLLVATTSRYTFWDGSGSSGSWYRSRYTNTAATTSSEYSTPFRAGAKSSYATLDSLLERLRQPDDTRYNQLEDLLVSSARYLDTRIGFDFLRHPQVSGDETRTFDVDDTGRSRFAVYGGIVSVTSVSYASSTGDALTALDGADWYLYPRQLEPEGTYTHVALSSIGSFPRTFRGQGVLSVTGAFGWPSPPTIIAEANLAHAAKSFNDWQTKFAGIVGNPEFGTVPLTPNLPDVVYRAIEAYRRYWWLAV